MWPIFSHSSLPSLQRQQCQNWQKSRHLWPTMENLHYFWHSKWHIRKLIKSFGAFVCWWNNLKIQREGGDMRLCIFECFQSTIQRRDSIRWCGGKGYIYIKQITTQKICSLNLTVFKNNYLGLCVYSYYWCVCTPLLEEFTCLSARICALWPWWIYLSLFWYVHFRR
jgi:hypothetical protein